ncbi:hypothetical protein ACF0H5_009224 [Mactra antiquata]
MTPLRLMVYLSTVFIIFMLNLVDCNNIRKLENGLGVLKGKFSTLENKVYEDEIKLQYEIEQIWRVLNSSNGGSVGILYENETGADQNGKMDTVEDVIRKIGERSELLTKGFTAEKSELRKRAKEFEKEIADIRNQHVTALTNFTSTTDEFISELNRTVEDKLNQMNSNLEKKAFDVMQRHVYDFANLNNSFNEQFIGFTETIEEVNNRSVVSLQHALKQMEMTHNDLLHSLSLKANKTFTGIEEKIDDELQKVKEAQEVTEGKTAQLEAMIKTVKDVFDECTKRSDKIENLLLYVPLMKCLMNGVRFENSCYLVSSIKATWQQAVDACFKMGAHLAEVNSAAENEFLAKVNIDVIGTMWLGGSDMDMEGVWKWHTSRQYFTFKKWRYTEPNGGRKENCLHFYGHQRALGEWNDIPCDHSLQYVCEFTI